MQSSVPRTHRPCRRVKVKCVGEAEHKSKGVVINIHTLSQSHHRSRHTEIAVPVTVMHEHNRSINEPASPGNHNVWVVTTQPEADDVLMMRVSN